MTARRAKRAMSDCESIEIMHALRATGGGRPHYAVVSPRGEWLEHPTFAKARASARGRMEGRGVYMGEAACVRLVEAWPSTVLHNCGCWRMVAAPSRPGGRKVVWDPEG